MKTLSVGEASKSFREYVDRVHLRKESFAIVKLGVPYALLVPASARTFDSHELAKALAKAGLSGEDKRAMATAIRRGRKMLKPIRNPWG